MIRLVVIDPRKYSYRVFEGNKCIAEYIVENHILLDAKTVEELRMQNYVSA